MGIKIPYKLDRRHWTEDDFKQRMRATEWRNILLDENDSINYNGVRRRLVARNLGYGVVEVSKAPLQASNDTIQ